MDTVYWNGAAGQNNVVSDGSFILRSSKATGSGGRFAVGNNVRLRFSSRVILPVTGPLLLLQSVFAAPKEIEISSFYAKVYVAPSTNANFIGLTQKGERYPILGVRDSWYHIRFKNINGWIQFSQVTVIDPQAPPPAETVSADTVPKDETGVSSANISPRSAGDSSGRSTTVTGSTAVTASSSGSTRSRSGVRTASSAPTQSSSQAVLPKKRSREDAKPTEKKESRLRSWFTQQNLPELPPTLYPDQEQQVQRYFQIKYPTRVLEYLSPEAPILGMTKRGQLLPLIGEGDSWCRVAFADTTGWIETRYGRIINPDASVSINYFKVGIIGGVLIVIILILVIIIIRLTRRPKDEVTQSASSKHVIIVAKSVKTIEYTLTNGTTTLERCFSEVGFTIVHAQDIASLQDTIRQVRPEVILIDYQYEDNVVTLVEQVCSRLDEADVILYLVYNVPDPGSMQQSTVLPKMAFLGPKFSDRDVFKLVTPLIRGVEGSTIQKSIQSSALAGDIAAGNLLEVLQFIEIGSKTGCLLVELEKPFAIICFKNGRIIFAATADKIVGRDAIFKVLELKIGKFRFVLDKKPRESNINLSTLEVLMEWAKAIDEAHQH
jgi:hypothetical protein